MFYLCKSHVNFPQSIDIKPDPLPWIHCRSLIYHCPASMSKVYVVQCYYIRVIVFKPTCCTATIYNSAARHAELNSPLVHKIQNCYLICWHLVISPVSSGLTSKSSPQESQTEISFKVSVIWVTDSGDSWTIWSVSMPKFLTWIIL